MRSVSYLIYESLIQDDDLPNSASHIDIIIRDDLPLEGKV
jgi:hypothetical protein